jgi:glutamine synthetase
VTSRNSIPLLQLEVPDYDHGLRSKLLRAEKFDKVDRSAFCTIIYGFDLCDEVVDTPLSNAENGYPDGFAVPDAATRVTLPWRVNTDAVICDMADDSGALLEESPRTLLRSLVARFEQHDLTPILGFEYEVFVFHVDDDVLREGRYADLRPLGRTTNCYDTQRLYEFADLGREFMERMQAIGVGVEAVHSELGPGFFEYALSPLPALAAADAAVRSRHYFRELCAERGLLATFMAKFRADVSGAGGHVHQSVMRDGVNAFASDPPGGLSDLGRHYLAGLVATMPDFTMLMSPFVNSFKRPAANLFVAETSTWGWDTRNAACRVIANSGASATRIEHRRPGADANPYLAAAAMLAGGWHGIDQGLVLGDPITTGTPPVGSPSMPRTLPDAIEVCRQSPVARALLGERFLASYVATRAAEAAGFERWWNSHISDWELSRHLQHI